MLTYIDKYSRIIEEMTKKHARIKKSITDYI